VEFPGQPRCRRQHARASGPHRSESLPEWRCQFVNLQLLQVHQRHLIVKHRCETYSWASLASVSASELSPCVPCERILSTNPQPLAQRLQDRSQAQIRNVHIYQLEHTGRLHCSDRLPAVISQAGCVSKLRSFAWRYCPHECDPLMPLLDSNDTARRMP